MTFFTWSKTAASNDVADDTVNLREGQAPSTINNSARAMMAAVAKYRDDASGNLVTGGTSTAYTATTNQGFTALTDGLSVVVRMHTTSGASPTFAPDGLTAKQIRRVYGTNVTTGELLEGAAYQLSYDDLDDAWLAHGLASGPKPIAEGGTGSNLTDPNADRVLFWDDSAGAMAWLTVSTGLAISTTNLALSHLGFEALTDPGGDRIPFWDDSEGAFGWASPTGFSFSGTEISLAAASTSLAGIVELATAAEVTTGSSAVLAVTPGTQQAHKSAAKAWAIISVSGGTPTVAASYNVSSIVDDGLGVITINLTTAFASASWACLVSIESSGARAVSYSDQTASAVQLHSFRTTDALALDPNSWSFAAFGTQ